MARKLISQAEAYRLRKQVATLQERDRVRMNQYRRSYPGGVYALAFRMSDTTKAALKLAEKLGCALVAKTSGYDLDIYAVLQE